MRYRRLGRTGLQVSELALGTVELGLAYGIAPQDTTSAAKAVGLPPPSPRQAVRLVQQALDAGINFIDTARAYGSSEEVLGQALQGRRDRVYLTTKVSCLEADGQPLQGEGLRQSMRRSIATSLRYLQTDYVDLLMLHSAPLAVLANGEAVTVLKEFQAAGLTRAIGVSTYGLEAPRLALEQGQIDVLQVAYNVLDQRMADEILPLAQARDVGIVIRSVYLKGALTDRAEDLPARLDALKQRSRRFREFAGQLTPPLSAIEAALRFVLSRPDVSTILVGVRTEPELTAAIKAVQAGPLPVENVARLETMRWDDPLLLDPSTWGIP